MPRTQQKIIILFGSQTGTAQDAAESMAMQSRGTHFSAAAIELDRYPVQDMVNEELIIFMCSTTGQGEPPDNMKKFWRFIMRKNLPSNSLQNLRFAVLGFGDSSYTKFNFIAKKLNRRIQQLGGQQLVSIGLADDQHEWGADATVDPWVTGVWKKLMEIYPTPYEALSPLGGALPPSRFDVNDDKQDQTTIAKGVIADSYSHENPFLAKVKSNVRVTAAKHFQETILVSLDVTHARGLLPYKPGDVAMIRPSNTKDNVKPFLECFSRFNPDRLLYFTPLDENVKLPSLVQQPTTLHELATTYLDFMSVPRRSFFQLFQHFADDEMEKEKLIELSTPEGTEERYTYVNRPRRNILEVLQDFHKTTKNIPLCRLLDLIPAIQPRAHSIASSPSRHKNEIQILVAVVKYKTVLALPRHGLCSTWLSTLKPGSKVPIWVKSGGIHFPDPFSTQLSPRSGGPDLPLRQTACIMIGPGTGVAPFRSAIHERRCKGVKENVLFFGCRGKDKDFYFEREWSEMVDEGFLTLYTAFSRDQERKIYVQERISERGKLLWDLVENQNAVIFVAGNSKNMPDAVRDAFIKIFQNFGGKTENEAKDYHERLQKSKRYQQETWS